MSELALAVFKHLPDDRFSSSTYLWPDFMKNLLCLWTDFWFQHKLVISLLWSWFCDFKFDFSDFSQGIQDFIKCQTPYIPWTSIRTFHSCLCFYFGLYFSLWPNISITISMILALPAVWILAYKVMLCGRWNFSILNLSVVFHIRILGINNVIN